MTARTGLPNTVARLSTLIIVCFFFSGMSGLIYEILWTRMTVSVIGGAPFAVATILTVFMGGLGLGSYLAARAIDRIKQPLKLIRLYGILELLIGAYGLVFPLLLLAFKPVYALIYNQFFEHFISYNLLTFAATSIILLVPVTLMGATLPILCRFYVIKLGHLATHAGRLYGLNTIGAAVGALLCGFWLISQFGIRGTLAVAVLINAIIGLVCLTAGYRTMLPEFTYHKQANGGGQSDGQQWSGHRGAIGGALFIFAVSGFCAMAYEVIWTKLLGVIVGPTTYSFTIVLVTFILGLALGSIFFGWLGDRTRNVLRLLIATQIAAGALALATSMILGGSQMFFAKLIFAFQDEFALRTFLKGVSLFVFMVLPTLCLGATFPLVGKIYTQSITKVGWSIGRAYAVNTIGAVLGSFVAGFILIPQIGKESGLSLVIGIQLATALIVAVVIMVKNRERMTGWIGYLALAVVGLALCFQYPVFDRRLLSLGKAYRVDRISVVLRGGDWLETLFNGNKILSRIERGELLYYGDGIGGFTTVLKSFYQMGDIHYVLTNSGKSDATNVYDMCTQTLSAHFPMIFHPHASRVLVVGLGSGVTGGEILNYPVDELDIIEINEQVVAASDFFIPWNNNVLADPRTNMIIQDGKAHLELSKEMYDAIISEPSNPWMAGLAALFTKEYFELAKDALNDDGMFVQFIHSYQMDWSTFALVGRTFAHVFPNSLMVSTFPSRLGPDYLLVGFKSAAGHRLEVARKNLAYAQRSTNIALSDARLIYKMIVAENLSQLFGEGSINTDASPLLEFAAPKLMYSHDESIENNVLSQGRLTEESSDISDQVRSDVDLQIDYAAYAISVHSPFPEMVNLAEATPFQQQRFFEIMGNYFAFHSSDPNMFVSESLRQHCRDAQIESITSRINSMPDKAVSYAYLAGLYRQQGQVDKAIESYQKSIRYDSANEVVYSNLGATFLQQGEINKAIEQFTTALKINSNFAEAYCNLGYAYAQLGDFQKAAETQKTALRLDPDNVMARYSMGNSLMRRAEYDGAIEYFLEVLRLQPLFADAHCDLGVALTQQGRLDEAERHFIEALRIRPDFEAAQTGLERARFLKQVRDR